MTQTGATLLQDLLPLLEEGRYIPALDFLREGLSQLRGQSTMAEWREFCAETFSAKHFQYHPLSRLLKAGPLESGPAGAARGLIHEPLTLDVIYGLDRTPPLLTSAADVLRPWELALGFCTSLRARHYSLVRELNDLGNLVQGPRVLAVGCGHLRDAAEALTLDNMREAEIVAFDRDRACIDLIEREYEHPGLRTVSGSLRDLLKDPTLGAFDFIYVPTLLDTIEGARVSALFDSLLPLLKPAGRLLAANFAPDLGDTAYLEACLDWWPFYRSEENLTALVNPASARMLRGQVMYRDDSGGSVFLDLQVL
jgi:SAM-dependent methyltransferase